MKLDTTPLSISPQTSELVDQNAVLEGIVTERKRELASTVAELEAFTYSVAHDLRAPLRAIQGFGHSLLEDHLHRFDGEALDYLQRIVKASERMSMLIDDLLKLSKVGRGEVERVPVDISSLAASICKSLGERNPGRDVQLEIQPAIVVNGDARLLAIAFENLLDNAWKFSRKRKLAIIRIYGASRNGVCQVCVSDNGTGFDMRYQHKLFAPFQRLHRADEFEGTGIGLVTVMRIIQRHSGSVSIESALDQGTTVIIQIPLGS